jgi:hypothetical protein
MREFNKKLLNFIQDIIIFNQFLIINKFETNNREINPRGGGEVRCLGADFTRFERVRYWHWYCATREP